MQKNTDIINDLKEFDSKMKKKNKKNKTCFIPGSYENPIMVKRKSYQSKVGRNESCPCGSGKKYKKCCQWRENIV